MGRSAACNGATKTNTTNVTATLLCWIRMKWFLSRCYGAVKLSRRSHRFPTVSCIAQSFENVIDGPYESHVISPGLPSVTW